MDWTALIQIVLIAGITGVIGFYVTSLIKNKELRVKISTLEEREKEVDQLKGELSLSKNENDYLKADKPELAALKEKVNNLENENRRLDKENSNFKQAEASRVTDHDKSIATLSSFQTRIENERKNEIEEKQKRELEKVERQKLTWSQHQDRVREAIKGLCQKHTIEYVEKVPFKGAPDNTVKIADEFVVFDAKSPASDDLSNFPLYIKAQAEQAKKYVKEENVKREVFLVIPSNTVEVVGQFVYNLPEYKIYVITLDALEPVLLSLKKLEEYEFIDQLSPEERDNISRVVGRFAYLTKRRIQVDQFFGQESLELLAKTVGDLPDEILEKAIEYEKSEKLNPPTDKRSKLLLSNEELQKKGQRIQKEAEVREIPFPRKLTIEEE